VRQLTFCCCQLYLLTVASYLYIAASAVDPLHLKYFTFAGRIIGLALMHKVQVGVVLDCTLFLHLAGRSITLEDIAVADPVKYSSCKKILEMDATEIDSLYLTFSREDHQLGSQGLIDLCPGGQDISVNIWNREQYIDLLIKNTFVDSMSEQLSHFSKGFSDILVNPLRRKEFFEFLDLEDLDQLLGGSSDTINVQDWRSHTQYNGYKEKDHQIIWFWKVGCISVYKCTQVFLFLCCYMVLFIIFSVCSIYHNIPFSSMLEFVGVWENTNVIYSADSYLVYVVQVLELWALTLFTIRHSYVFSKDTTMSYFPLEMTKQVFLSLWIIVLPNIFFS
jgi:hypothetical protein